METEDLKKFRQEEAVRLLRWMAEGNDEWEVVATALEYDLVSRDVDGKWFARCIEILMKHSFYYLIPFILMVAHHDWVGSLAIDNVILNKVLMTMNASGMDALCEDFIRALYTFVEKKTIGALQTS